MRKVLVLFLVIPLLFSFSAKKSSNFVGVILNTPPDTLSWTLLGRIKFVTQPDDIYGQVEWPQVNQQLKATQGKEIVMSGFIIPIDNESYALSKNVFASCFFCGQAGPETIMGIKFKDPSIRLKTDTYVSLKGKFRYNEKNVEDWIYHIEDAVIIDRP